MKPAISVIIPVYNGGEAFRQCLQALAATTYASWECIVVDDGSTDESRRQAQRHGYRVLTSPCPQMGPAAARNVGAQAAMGDILFFIDADVLVRPETVGLVAEVIGGGAAPGGAPAACFGSYDARPGAGNFLSQYRNLLHHYVHQMGQEEATTFWSGCGAMRRSVFLELGGFNVEAYPRPSIEDIELGYRVIAAGYQIRLIKTLQVTHLKRWTAMGILKTDIRDRALPWTRLLLRQGSLANDLNLQTGQRVSVALALLSLSLVLVVAASLLGLAAGAAVSSLAWGAVAVAWVMWLLAAGGLYWLNRSFYGFLAQERGAGFALRVLPWHWLYFVYSGVCFAACLLWYSVLHVRNPAPLIVPAQVRRDAANA